jgi:glycerate kinase
VPHRALVAAPDKFRGTARASEVARAIAVAAAGEGWATIEKPLADGGEGLLDVVDGQRRSTMVAGPLGAPVEAEWRFLPAAPGRPATAVIEMARASGIALVGGAAGNDPIRASTRGTGELVRAAVREGAMRVVVGCGGSATTDGGEGFVEALEGGAALEGAELLAASDVTTSFLDAATVFGPQKGATPAQVVELSARLHRVAARYRAELGVEVRELPGTGAAGGLAGAVAALGGRVVSGFDLVAGLVDLEGALRGAELVVTGEGSFDATSLEGKVVAGVLKMVSGRAPVLVVAGTVVGVSEAAAREALGLSAGAVEVVSLVDRFGRERALTETAALVGEVVAERLRRAGQPAAG